MAGRGIHKEWEKEARHARRHAPAARYQRQVPCAWRCSSSAHGEDGQAEPDARDDARLDEEGEVKSDRARHQRRELLLVRLEYFHAAVSAHGACAHCRTRHAKWHTGGRMVSCVVRRTKLLRSGCRAWPARAATLSRSRRTARSGSAQQRRLCKRLLRTVA